MYVRCVCVCVKGIEQVIVGGWWGGGAARRRRGRKGCAGRYLQTAATAAGAWSLAAACTTELAEDESSPLTIFSMDLSSLLTGGGGGGGGLEDAATAVRCWWCRCDGDRDDCLGGGRGAGDVCCNRPPLTGDWRSSGAGGGVLPADEHRPGVTVSNAEPTDDG